MIRRIAFLLFVIVFASGVYCAPEDSLEPFGTNPEEEYTNDSYYDSFSNKYVFEYIGNDEISYSIYPNRWEIQAGYINIETRINNVVCWPVAYGGLRFRYDLVDEYAGTIDENEKDIYRQGRYYNPIDYRLDAEVEITNIDFSDGILSLDYKDVFEGYEHTWKVEFSIKGKTLTFHIYATDGSTDALGNYCGVYFDRSIRTRNPKWYILPFIVESNVVFDDNYFYAVYVDRGKSSASDIQVEAEAYSNDSIYSGSHTVNWINRAGESVPVDEVCYLTVSSKLLDVFPSFNIQPSWTRKMLDDKVVLDIVFTEDLDLPGNHFQGVRRVLSNFYDYGFRDILVINHTWQHHGYDSGLPHHFPPGEIYGGLDDFKKITEFANQKGWLFTAHEDYTVMNQFNRCFHEGYFNDEDCTWDRGDTIIRQNEPPVPFFVKHLTFYSISPDKMLYYAEKDSTKLKEECNTTAAFLDLHAGNNPMTVRQIDLNPDNKNANTFKAGVEYTKQLFDAMREIHQGPVVGEGGIGWGRYDTFYAGYLDGVDKFPERETNAFIVPEHELKVIKPLQANHGMGQYDRYFRWTGVGFEGYDFDLYRASEIAFGHAGFIQVKTIGRELLNLSYLKFCREYYMMQQLQERYLPSDVVPVEILYYDDGNWITQDELILLGRDMEDVLLKLKYSNGLTIWINHKDDDFVWEPDIHNGITLPIPKNGFAALNLNEELFIACSILIGGQRIDYVLSSEYIFAENRSHISTDIGYLSTDGMAVVQINDTGHLDMHILEGSYISETIAGSMMLETSSQCHINLNFRNIDELELIAPFIFGQEKMTVKYSFLPGKWLSEDNRLPADIPAHFSVSVVEGESEIPTQEVVISTETGRELIIENVVVETKYLVKFTE